MKLFGYRRPSCGACYKAMVHTMSSRGSNDPTLARLAELNERTSQAEPELHQLLIRISQLKASQLADAEIKAAFSDFDTLWRSVSQREQGKLMEVLVERVEYDPHDVAISVSFHRSGIKTLAAKADEVLV